MWETVPKLIVDSVVDSEHAVNEMILKVRDAKVVTWFGGESLFHNKGVLVLLVASKCSILATTLPVDLICLDSYADCSDEKIYTSFDPYADMMRVH